MSMSLFLPATAQVPAVRQARVSLPAGFGGIGGGGGSGGGCGGQRVVSVAWRGAWTRLPLRQAAFARRRRQNLSKIYVVVCFTFCFPHPITCTPRVKGQGHCVLQTTHKSFVVCYILFPHPSTCCVRAQSRFSILEYAAQHCPSHLCVSAVPCEKSGFTARRCVVAS